MIKLRVEARWCISLPSRAQVSSIVGAINQNARHMAEPQQELSNVII